MGIIQTLGSRTRVLTLLQLLGDERPLRDLAVRYRLAIPGFRPAQAPLNLIARTVARTCWSDPELQAGLERILESAGSREAASASTDVTESLSRLGELPRNQVLQVLLRGLRDERPEVLSQTVQAIDAVGAGRLRLRPEPAGGRPVGAGAHRDEGRSAGSPGRPGGPHSGSDSQIATLRAESTQQERKLQRLREQLERERDAHLKTRKLLEAARREGAASAAESAPTVELKRVRRELAEQEQQMVEIRGRHDTALRDYRLIVEGCRLLENVVSDLLAGTEPAGVATPLRPLRPARRSGLPPESKGPIPEPGGLWPAHFDSFLRRLAASEYVERVQPLGCAAGRSTRINLEVPNATLIAQYSDGTRAARFLIVTSAHSTATLHWVRRHLIESYFPNP